MKDISRHTDSRDGGAPGLRETALESTAATEGPIAVVQELSAVSDREFQSRRRTQPQAPIPLAPFVVIAAIRLIGAAQNVGKSHTAVLNAQIAHLLLWRTPYPTNS